MAKHEREGESKSLAKLDDSTPWRGDEHELRLAAAREAGLEPAEIHDVAFDLVTAGFTAGMVLADPSDRSIVLHGRTVLREKQMSKALSPTLRYLRIPIDQVALRISDGEFELRVSRTVAEAAQPTLDSAKITLKLWLGAGLIGFLAWNMFGLGWLATIVWGVALVLGGYVLRQGTFSGRSMLAARLTVALALLAKEEKLILPPARATGEGGSA